MPACPPHGGIRRSMLRHEHFFQIEVRDEKHLARFAADRSLFDQGREAPGIVSRRNWFRHGGGVRTIEKNSGPGRWKMLRGDSNSLEKRPRAVPCGTIPLTRESGRRRRGFPGWKHSARAAEFRPMEPTAELSRRFLLCPGLGILRALHFPAHCKCPSPSPRNLPRKPAFTLAELSARGVEKLPAGVGTRSSMVW